MVKGYKRAMILLPYNDKLNTENALYHNKFKRTSLIIKNIIDKKWVKHQCLL